jgi:hypothetical protein
MILRMFFLLLFFEEGWVERESGGWGLFLLLFFEEGWVEREWGMGATNFWTLLLFPMCVRLFFRMFY